MLILTILLGCAAVVADDSRADCFFLPTPWESHGGWWCCKLVTISVERNETVRVLDRITDKCAASFPKLLDSKGGDGLKSSSGGLPGFVIWLIAVGVVVFVLLVFLTGFFVWKCRRNRGISRSESSNSSVTVRQTRGGVIACDRFTCTTSARTSRCGEAAVGAFDDGAGRLTAMRIWVTEAARTAGDGFSRSENDPKEFVQLASCGEVGKSPAAREQTRETSSKILEL